MERKTIEKTIGESLFIDTDTSYGATPFCIDELQNFLSKAKTNGATHINITGSCWDGALGAVYIEPVKVFKESDDDYKRRLENDEARRLAEVSESIAREKALYNALKLKYGEWEVFNR